MALKQGIACRGSAGNISGRVAMESNPEERQGGLVCTRARLSQCGVTSIEYALIAALIAIAIIGALSAAGGANGENWTTWTGAAIAAIRSVVGQ